MERCFVIQPFDKGRFDKRYEDVLAPAIRKAELEPYRVDRDPSTSIPIEDIKAGIEASEACLAEIQRIIQTSGSSWAMLLLANVKYF
jgi:hypothetical protein